MIVNKYRLRQCGIRHRKDYTPLSAFRLINFHPGLADCRKFRPIRRHRNSERGGRKTYRIQGLKHIIQFIDSQSVRKRPHGSCRNRRFQNTFPSGDCLKRQGNGPGHISFGKLLRRIFRQGKGFLSLFHLFKTHEGRKAACQKNKGQNSRGRTHPPFMAHHSRILFMKHPERRKHLLRRLITVLRVHGHGLLNNF